MKKKILEFLEEIFVIFLWLLILPLAFTFKLFEKKKKEKDEKR